MYWVTIKYKNTDGGTKRWIITTKYFLGIPFYVRRVMVRG